MEYASKTIKSDFFVFKFITCLGVTKSIIANCYVLMNACMRFS